MIPYVRTSCDYFQFMYSFTLTEHYFLHLRDCQASAGAEITRTTRQLDRRINLDANCTGEAASHSLDCQGMDHELQTPRGR